MELRSTREMRRNEQLAKTTLKKAETADASAAPQPALKREGADRCTLSQQALKFLEAQNRLTQELEERQARQQNRFAEYQNKSNELDLLGKQMKAMEKCLKIAASIMKGNRVPLQDLKYLMENDPAGYKLAMALRKENPDPKDEKSVLDDEDQNGGSTEGTQSGGGEAPSVQAAAAADGGGEVSAAE